MRRTALVLIVGTVLQGAGLLPCAAQQAGDYPAAEQQPALGTSGMVSTAHPLATEVGLQILRAGGNAFDAAVAIAAALNVVEPMMSGIGGYGTILVYDARAGKSRFLNPSGRIPATVDSDVYRPPTPDYLENRGVPRRYRRRATSTPGKRCTGSTARWNGRSCSSRPSHTPTRDSS